MAQDASLPAPVIFSQEDVPFDLILDINNKYVFRNGITKIPIVKKVNGEHVHIDLTPPGEYFRTPFGAAEFQASGKGGPVRKKMARSAYLPDMNLVVEINDHSLVTLLSNLSNEITDLVQKNAIQLGLSGSYDEIAKQCNLFKPPVNSIFMSFKSTIRLKCSSSGLLRPSVVCVNRQGEPKPGSLSDIIENSRVRPTALLAGVWVKGGEWGVSIHATNIIVGPPLE